MSDVDLQPDADGQVDAVIEASILAARDYVCPSNDLRPRILEQARELDADKRSLRRFGTAMSVMVMLVLIVAPALVRLGWLQGPSVGPSEQQIHAASIKLVANSGMSPDWALLETFNQWRRSLAIRFDHRGNNLR